jgi:hypothetical protein
MFTPFTIMLLVLVVLSCNKQCAMTAFQPQRISTRLTTLRYQQDGPSHDLPSKVAVLENKMDSVLTTLVRMEKKMDSMEKKIDSNSVRLETKIDATNSKLSILIVAFSVLLTMFGMVNLPQLVALFK